MARIIADAAASLGGLDDPRGDATTLSSMGIAARFGWGHLRAELAVAKRLQHPSAIDSQHGTLQDRGIHFQVSYAVF